MEQTRVARTLDTLGQIAASYRRIVFWLSGGKDSTVLCHLARKHASAITLISAVMDDGWPDVEAHVQTIAGWGFNDLLLVRPTLSFADYRARFGWPTHLVPTAMDGVLPDPFYDGGPLVSSWWHCSALRMFQPLLSATYAYQPDIVLTATRSEDGAAFARLGATTALWQIDPSLWMRCNPLMDWTTEDIWSYVDAYRVPMLAHYAWGRPEGIDIPDCQHCPYNAPYIKALARHEPAIYLELSTHFGPTLTQWREQVATHLATWEGVFHG